MKSSGNFPNWLLPSIWIWSQYVATLGQSAWEITFPVENKQRFITTAPRNDRRVASLSRSSSSWGLFAAFGNTCRWDWPGDSLPAHSETAWGDGGLGVLELSAWRLQSYRGRAFRSIETRLVPCTSLPLTEHESSVNLTHTHTHTNAIPYVYFCDAESLQSCSRTWSDAS